MNICGCTILENLYSLFFYKNLKVSNLRRCPNCEFKNTCVGNNFKIESKMILWAMELGWIDSFSWIDLIQCTKPISALKIKIVWDRLTALLYQNVLYHLKHPSSWKMNLKSHPQKIKGSHKKLIGFEDNLKIMRNNYLVSSKTKIVRLVPYSKICRRRVPPVRKKIQVPKGEFILVMRLKKN